MSDLYEREDWMRYSAAMRTIAAAFGTSVDCHPKNNRLAVDFRSAGVNQEQLAALAVIETLVELVREFPASYLEELAPPGHELARVVPVYIHGGRRYFVRIGEIPDPWRGVAWQIYRSAAWLCLASAGRRGGAGIRLGLGSMDRRSLGWQGIREPEMRPVKQIDRAPVRPIIAIWRNVAQIADEMQSRRITAPMIGGAK